MLLSKVYGLELIFVDPYTAGLLSVQTQLFCPFHTMQLQVLQFIYVLQVDACDVCSTKCKGSFCNSCAVWYRLVTVSIFW